MLVVLGKKFKYLPYILSVALAISVPITKQPFMIKEGIYMCSNNNKKKKKGGKK